MIIETNNVTKPGYRLQYYITNFIKLLDQETDYSWQRHSYVMDGNLAKAREIEEKYIIVLQRKISLLAEQYLKEFTHEE